MALQGTLKDFGLADILQLIGMQRKTGVLKLDNGKQSVSVKFLDGQVVGADEPDGRLESRLGQVLVRKGRITEEQLAKALKTQKDSLQRLGRILVASGHISIDTLRDALQTQVLEAVFRLFRWKEGSYRFSPMEHVDYEADCVSPVSAETILMEGARMADEWPIIHRKIRSPRAVFRRTTAAESLEAPVESAAETDIDLTLDDDGGAGDVRVAPEERELLRLVDGQSSVQEIVDRSTQGEFDVYRVLYELLNRQLVEETAVATVARRRSGRVSYRLVNGILRAGMAATVLLSLATIADNPFSPWKAAFSGSHADSLRAYVSRDRLERLERAIQLFYLDLGAFPDGLDRLAEQGYLAERELADPWGRPYLYDLSPAGYRLAGLDSAGRPRESLTLTRRFSSARRMVLDGSGDTRLSLAGP